MSSNFSTPGIYRQDVFMRTSASMPTGVPAFVGFAATAARLDSLPQPLAFPESLRERIRYDANRRLLTCEGLLSASDADALRALTTDEPFRRAVETLARNAQTVMALQRKEEFFDNFSPPTGSFLAEAITGFFQNGGVRCYIARAVPAGTSDELVKAMNDATDALAPFDDLDLVAVPDAMLLNISSGDPNQDLLNPVPNVPAIVSVQAHVLKHCAEHLGRFAILDAVRGGSPVEVIRQRESIGQQANETISGALYFPWLRTVAGRLLPPSGHVAGIYARTDGRAGVFKAPANGEVFGVIDLEVSVPSEMQGELNPLGINCFRVFPGRGIRVWGARTLSRDVNWRYVNVRRLFLTVCRWIDFNMPWASYEPNEPRLWVRIQRDLGDYLRGLWTAGALAGQTPEQAFYVKCDSETNPPEVREAGQAITEIGIAPSSPAEFVVVRVLHRAGTTEVL